jgi:hypothetical protein
MSASEKRGSALRNYGLGKAVLWAHRNSNRGFFTPFGSANGTFIALRQARLGRLFEQQTVSWTLLRRRLPRRLVSSIRDDAANFLAGKLGCDQRSDADSGLIVIPFWRHLMATKRTCHSTRDRWYAARFFGLRC